MILLATGISSIEETLVKQIEAQRCYNRDILIDIAREVKPEIVILSPYLPGEEDLFQIILSLRNLGKRIIFLPGDPKLTDAQGWMIRLIPYGVYDFVYDPVTVSAITERIKVPATLGDIPRSIVRAADGGGESFAKDIVGSIKKEPPKFFYFIKGRMFNKKTQPRPVDDMPVIKERPEERVRITSATSHFLFISPWQDKAGVSEIVFSLNNILGWSMVDANCKNPMLSKMLGIHERDRWQYDWRSFGGKSLIEKQGKALGLLDPNLHTPCEESTLHEIIPLVAPPVIWDCGSDPDSIVFQKLLPGSTVIIVVDATQSLEGLGILLEMTAKNSWGIVVNKAEENMDDVMLRLTGRVPLAHYPSVVGKTDYQKWQAQEKALISFISAKRGD